MPSLSSGCGASRHRMSVMEGSEGYRRLREAGRAAGSDRGVVPAVITRISYKNAGETNCT